MDPIRAILKNVAHFRKVSIDPVVFQRGDLPSQFKQQGGTSEIQHIRKYVHGDEVRHIDRNVTARTGNFHVRIYREDLGFDLLFLQDISSSMDFGIRTKKDIAVDVIAALATASHNNIRGVHLISFSDQIEKTFFQDYTDSSPVAIVRQAHQAISKKAITDLDKVLKYVLQIQKRKAIVCILSDFVVPQFPMQQLALLSKTHLIFAVHILDPLEVFLPDSGWVRFEDSESGQELLWNLGHPQKRKIMEDFVQKKLLSVKKNLHKIGAQYIQLVTSENYLQKLWVYLSSPRRLK